MGADLIGYFAKGPKNLDPNNYPAAAAEAERRLVWLRKARPKVEAVSPAAVVDLLPDCPWLPPEELKQAVVDIDFDELRCEIERLVVMADDIIDLTGEQAVQRFVEMWPPLARDAAHIQDPDRPDKLIVFAGERSWGDTPDGLGFRTLSWAGLLGIAPILGVWIEAAFFTLRLPTPGNLPQGDQHESTP
ncbi:MAG: hypothetical protein AAGH88_08885 [Planctomycetota bacterium]